VKPKPVFETIVTILEHGFAGFTLKRCHAHLFTGLRGQMKVKNRKKSAYVKVFVYSQNGLV